MTLPLSSKPQSSVWPPVLAALVLQLLFIGLCVWKLGHGDISCLVSLGDDRFGMPSYEKVTRTIGPGGYDGQFFYALAQQPWTAHGPDLDSPAYRHVRILYPAMCWALSGGDAGLLLWVMPLVNVALTGLLAYMGVGFARAHGLGRWWGLSLPVAVNAFMPPLHDLSDTAAMVALFALFWAWLRGGPAWGIALAGAAACLAREQNAAVVALILPAGLIARRPTTSFAATAALAVWAGWVLVVRQMYGQSPFIASNFDAPFDGLLFQFQHLGGNERFSTRKALFIIPMLALLLVEIGFAAYLAVRDRDGVVAGAVLGGVLLMCLVNDFVFRDFWSVTRIFVWIPLGVWILSVRAGKIWPIRIQMVAIMWPFAAALKYV